MKSGMKHVINRATLAGAFALVSSSAFAQFYQQDRRQYGAPQYRQQVRPAPQRQAAPPQRAVPAQAPQARAQATRVEPFVMPKGPCFSKEGTPEAIVAACSAVIEAAKDKPQAMSVAHGNRGEVYREKGELDKALEDLNQAVTLDPKNAQRGLQPRPRLPRQGRA